MKKAAVVMFVLVCACFMDCSTQPKNPGEVYSLRKQAETQLEMGNKEADRGSPGTALSAFDQAMRLAVSADDSGLRIRAGLSRSNVLFSLGRADEAAEGWNRALGEAERTGNAELAAVCRIHIARGRLLSEGKSAASSVRDEVNRSMGQIKSDMRYVALAWTVASLADKELGNYSGAEAAARRSLDIHEKGRYFELAAYDWFIIASSRSLSGNYNGARQALETAIAFDRRVENSWGLASDWRALGDVEKKAGNRDASRAAYTRAAEIFSAIKNEAAAADALSRITD